MESISPRTDRWERLRRKMVVMMLAACALAGLMAIFNQRQQLLLYHPVDAEVKDTAVRGGAGRYAPAVRFQYAADGAVYESDRYSSDLPAQDTGSQAHAEKLAARFKTGEHVTAYYDPLTPGNAFLVRRVHIAPYALAILPAIAGAMLSSRRALGLLLSVVVAGALCVHYFMMMR